MRAAGPEPRNHHNKFGQATLISRETACLSVEDRLVVDNQLCAPGPDGDYRFAVWATLARVADQARSAGDPRSRDQVMADALVERITGRTRADALSITVNLVISDQALLAA